jgi:hypothetical protein
MAAFPTAPNSIPIREQKGARHRDRAFSTAHGRYSGAHRGDIRDLAGVPWALAALHIAVILRRQ